MQRLDASIIVQGSHIVRDKIHICISVDGWSMR